MDSNTLVYGAFLLFILLSCGMMLRMMMMKKKPEQSKWQGEEQEDLRTRRPRPEKSGTDKVNSKEIP